ncbi:MAG: tripartite tricarboxylate transporter TctB family protein [Geminicoccaceae bacterium]|nr:tripartite tricarboxylate transporter TctB family protein [Geminicoccaceae bacterium]
MFREVGRLLRAPVARNDVILALALYAFSAVLYWQASLLPPPFFDPLGSAAVPKFVAVVLVILATLVLVRLVADRRESAPPVDEATPPEEEGAPPAPLVALGAVLIPTAYVGVMAIGLLGFREATVLFVFALGALLARFRRGAVLILIPAALAIGLLFDFVFTQVFFVDLPKTFGR